MSYKMSPESTGIKEFRCSICNRKLILGFTGSIFELLLSCSRCKTLIMVTSVMEIPIVVNKMRALQLERQKVKATQNFQLDSERHKKVG